MLKFLLYKYFDYLYCWSHCSVILSLKDNASSISLFLVKVLARTDIFKVTVWFQLHFYSKFALNSNMLPEIKSKQYSYITQN